METRRQGFSRARRLLLAGAGALCGALLPATASAITDTEALARAEQWVDAKLPYCQSPNHASDTIDSACAPVCVRQDNPAWDPYRSDCSGFVSWAWGLPPPGETTSTLAPAQTDQSHEIQAADLALGDALNNPGHHILFFKAWVTMGQEATFLEESGCSATEPYARQFTAAVQMNGSTIHVDGSETFTAIRFNDIQQTVGMGAGGAGGAGGQPGQGGAGSSTGGAGSSGIAGAPSGGAGGAGEAGSSATGAGTGGAGTSGAGTGGAGKGGSKPGGAGSSAQPGSGGATGSLPDASAGAAGSASGKAGEGQSGSGGSPGALGPAPGPSGQLLLSMPADVEGSCALRATPARGAPGGASILAGLAALAQFRRRKRPAR